MSEENGIISPSLHEETASDGEEDNTCIICYDDVNKIISCNECNAKCCLACWTNHYKNQELIDLKMF